MIKSIDGLSRLFARFWYPVTLPEDVTETLGVEVSNFLSFDELINRITNSSTNPLRLSRFMPRRDAEKAFAHATCVEHFGEKTLVSYFFPQGWIEFVLKFDHESRLRRVYVQHKDIESEEGIEITLCCSYIGNRVKREAPMKQWMSPV